MRIAAPILTLGALCLGFTVAYAPPLSSQAPQRAGEVSRLIPAVSIDRGDRRLVAEAQAPVYWKDLVATERLARARISLDDGSTLNVGSNASLRIIQHDAADQQTRIELSFGRLRAKVVRLARPGAKFEIQTPVATTGVVGTDFFLQQGEGEPAPGAKIDVAVLPFTAGSGMSLSESNTEALAKQLGDQLAQSGRVTAAVIAPPARAAGAIGPQEAAQAGRATDATIVILPVIEQAQAKEIQKGFGGGFGRFHIPGVSGGQLKHVAANVQLQAQMIRSADASALKSFDVASKKEFNNVNVNVAGYSTDLGTAEVENPDFQKSPLGQMLADAMAKLAAQVQADAAQAVKQAEAAGSSAGATTFKNDIATVVDFEGSVRFCNLKQQCVLVGPGMMSTIRDGQPPDPPHPAPASVIRDAEQSTTVGPSAPPAPVTTASGPPPGAPATAAASTPAATGVQVHFRPFSADVVNTFQGKATEGKVYTGENAMRMEGEENGRKGVTIIRYDRDVMWFLIPEQKMYLEQRIGLGADWSKVKGAKIQRDSLGTEQVGPYYCDKYHVRVTYKGDVYNEIEWDARELNGFTVKLQDEKGKWTEEWRNIRLGPQDPSLFEVPAGYRKFGMGGMQPEHP